MEIRGAAALAASLALAACGGTTGLADAGLFDGAAAETGAPDAADAAPVPDASVPCGAAPCGVGEVCVITDSSGGPCRQPDDAGACPSGSVRSGACSVFQSTTYACKPAPPACAGAISCGCATALCGGCSCRSASAADLRCQCLLP